ncbi:MAG: WD40/YVTN/BNR-like repeat-containing protein, partial [Rhodothermales bacterium]
SDDGGFTFKKTKGEGNFGNRPFYYFDIYVDPVNENRVYSIHSRVTYSEDGGETWKSLIGREVHPDHHAWWIHPDNPNLIYEGNDGGMAISRDRGETWRFVENLPLAQFYHIRVDMETPYRVCGGLQDNGSWCGPSQVWRSGGIRNAYWEEVAFGDGFDVMIHPDDPNTGYAMSQGGNVRRFDLVTGYQKNIKPIHPDGTPLRFNWNAGIAQDPFDANTIYYGSQFLHKSTDQGDSWTIISPDLTTNDPEKQKQLETGGLTYDNSGAENFTTIIAIDPSPLDRNVLWVGTDDGNVQVTRDGGQNWENVVGNIDGVPEGTWVPHFKASKHDAGEAFVVFDDHRRNNWEPYVYRTRDFGQSWERLADSDDVWGYALAIEQDPVASNLLFLGTEFGLYISIDDGATWTQFTNGYPTASTMDLVVHPRDHDLVIGTFGRAIYILDDIRPLRALAQQGADLLDAPLVVFDAPDAYQAIYRQATGTRFAAAAMYAGENRPRGAMLTYVVNPEEPPTVADAGTNGGGTNGNQGGEMAAEARADSAANGPKKDKVKIEILNGDGEVIRTLEGPAEPGINRTYWGMRRKGIRFGGGFFGGGGGQQQREDVEPPGASVLPGTYTARISYGDHKDSTTVTVKMDPRIDVNVADLEARLALYDRWEANAKLANDATERIRKAKETIEAVGKRLGDQDDDAAKDLKKQGKAMTD